MIIQSGMRLTPQRLSIPTGQVLVTGTGTVVDTPVSYGFTFGSVPRVGAIINGAASTSADVRVTGVTTTGFTLRLYGVGGVSVTLTNVAVDWWAIPA